MLYFVETKKKVTSPDPEQKNATYWEKLKSFQATKARSQNPKKYFFQKKSFLTNFENKKLIKLPKNILEDPLWSIETHFLKYYAIPPLNGRGVVGVYRWPILKKMH